MARARVRCLPVVDRDGELLGIVTKGDLLKHYLRSDDEVRRVVEEDIIGTRLLLVPFAVTVSVTEGVVTLCGTVDSPTLRDQLVANVRALPGVIDVDTTHLRVHIDPITTPVTMRTWI
jgi:osmotically-inducible protein OsmY